ncbi:hypothetical protein OG250_20645 [Streptomyces sp. NBC_00487]|uniref:hypothetical protein n=1 Tax=unclassified Streptomyces TaxID=2593676 RepID=UPI002E198D39|nr:MULTISPECIES: hypothetical protein [unclassified Streptomyces]
MHSVTTRRLTTVVVAGAASLAVLAPAASASEAGPHQGTQTAASQTAAAKLPAKLTVKSYTAYLKAQRTPEAKRTLKSFSALPAAKKTAFVGHLQNGKIYASLFRQLKGNVNHPVKTVTPYNKDVKFVHEVSSSKHTKGAVAVSYTATETIYGIPVTSEKLTLHYKIVKGKVQRNARAVAKVTNVNAALAIKGGGVKVAVKGIARADVTWKATPKVQAVGKPVLKDQAVTGHLNTWTASLIHG